MSEISFIKISNADVLPIDIKEVKRYLKISKSEAVVEELISEAIEEVYKKASLNAVFLRTKIEVENDSVLFDFDTVKSKDLSKNLASCKEAYIFCATLGIEIDRLIVKYSKTEPSKAVIIDSVSSALVESFCNYINDYLAKEESLRPRFSCGYGDFSITHQDSILKSLDAGKKLGVLLSESYMMSPAKTVTAIIGIK